MYEIDLWIIKKFTQSVFLKKKMKLWIKGIKSHMKMQKSVIFIKKNLEINVWKIKNIAKLEIIS